MYLVVVLIQLVIHILMTIFLLVSHYCLDIRLCSGSQNHL